MTIEHDNEPKNLDEFERQLVPIALDSIHVYQWTPERDGRGKPTEVHVHMQMEGLEEFAFTARFKGPRTLDKLIAVLLTNRREVWGND